MKAPAWMSVKQRFVFAILNDCEETRGDDRLLQLEAFERQGLHLTKEQKQIFMRCMPTETVRRERQIIQSAGFFHYLPKNRQQSMLDDSNQGGARV